MNIEQAINYLKSTGMSDEQIRTVVDAITYEDAISRQAVIYYVKAHIHEIITESGIDKNEHTNSVLRAIMNGVETMPYVTPKPKTGYCKDCKWWKDSDGVFRRGIGAESQCPMNRKEVFEGNGYCFLFESREESEDK